MIYSINYFNMFIGSRDQVAGLQQKSIITQHIEDKMANNVTDSSFKKEVLESDLPVLVDFWAEWCGPCKMLTPIIDEISKELKGKVKVLKMNIDENPNISSEYGIRSIPTIMLFKNGEQKDTKIGLQQKNSLLDWINKSV
ncbi:Thioredoxin [Rickettsia akari str. Hartford]|uniref:Thioredoxin n=1 Tax=Rickettsia akari (strain Hartford) TaxID=293614 RepID=A8GLR4_RICAH|nr:Thioredoxin [Rickettsia akari str. Hartford]